MTTHPRFSVVIPCYNYAATLPVALESVLAQGRDDVEIVLVDDASTDNTAVVAEHYRGRVRYLRNPANLGHPGTWGRAMQEARGEYVVNLDADDWLLPGYFDRVERALTDEIGMVVHSVYDYRMDSETIALRSIAARDEMLPAADFRKRLLNRIFFRTPGMLLRRSLAVASAPPDARIWNADWEFLLRATRGYGAYVIAEPLAVYRIHARSISGNAKASTARLQESCRLFLAITRDPGGAAYLDATERQRFAAGLSQLYLRIVGSRMSLRDARSALSHLKFAVQLAGSENVAASFATLAFFIQASVERALMPLAHREARTIVPSDLLPVMSEGE